MTSLRTAVTLALLCLPLLGGCEEDEPAAALPCAGETGDAAEACLTTHYFQGYEPQTTPACAGAGFVPTQQKVAQRKELTLFLGTGDIVDVDVRTEGRFLQRFFEP